MTINNDGYAQFKQNIYGSNNNLEARLTNFRNSEEADHKDKFKNKNPYFKLCIENDIKNENDIRESIKNNGENSTQVQKFGRKKLRNFGNFVTNTLLKF